MNRSNLGAQLLAVVLTLGSVGNVAGQIQTTTIEDVVYRADGQRFSGTIRIEWRSFLAADNSTVAAYSKNVQIVSGLLKTALVPTTTASVGAYYLVRYMVNGRVQTTEYWGVRPSTASLKLRDIRLVGPPTMGQLSSPTTVADVSIAEVTGLPEELNARAKKGIGYLPSRAAVINADGDLDAAAGEPTDCVRVNGTSGTCGSGSSGPAFVDSEVPAGSINGTNAVFTLANPPSPVASLQVFRNGLLQRSSVDYTLAGNVVTFLSGSIPQSGDLVTANYRLGASAGQVGGEAGGALAGYFPAPSIAAGAIANSHIASSAGIQESKLALSFPTHSNANDPTAEQKAALTGTAGSPSMNNRFVTDIDSRLTNARPPSQHPLLGTGHQDTNSASAVRGDLIVGLGTNPTLWSRLPLGAPNRCLISNGLDVVWNACLFTGFPAGAVTFADSSGVLTHNINGMFWNNAERRLGVGTASPDATLTVFDGASSTGRTGVNIKAGENQANAALTRWMNFAGADLARIEQDGSLWASRVKATSTSSSAAWQDGGATTDPTTLADGDAWFNSAEHARKTRESAQTHPQPQVICSTVGAATSSTTLTNLGTCTIPVGMVRTGDRFEVRYDLSHEGSTMAFSLAVKWGSLTLMTGSLTGTEAGAAGRVDALPQGASLYASWQSWGGTATPTAGRMSGAAPSGAIQVSLQGQMSGTTGETISLRNLTVIRYPAQQNP